MSRTCYLPVLMYHHVSAAPGLVTLSPATFREQMHWLASSGWKTLSAAEVEGFYRGKPLPRKSVMLTFDDGWRDNWHQVYPVLKAFGLKAHIFLITGLIGNGPVRYGFGPSYSHRECEQLIAVGRQDEVMLRWSEVHEMQREGLVEFHAHTHSHRRWDQLGLSPDVQHEHLAADIIRCRDTLLSRTGSCSRHLCWPEGYYSPDYIRTAQTLGFSYLYTTERRMNAPDKGSLQIGRISTKEREHSAWLKRRLFYYTTPVFSSLLALHKGPRVCDN